MRKLNMTDELFLRLERRQQPMHVGCLFLFSKPKNSGEDYVHDLFNRIKTFDKPTTPFNFKLHKKLGKYYWVEDDEFDIDHHVRFHALPRPHRIRELLSYVSIEHSNLMHRERPLWEFTLIEGIENNRFAIYIKTHHALLDGVSGLKMMMRSFTEKSDLFEMPPLWAFPERETKKKARKRQSFLNKDFVLNSAKSGLTVGNLIRRELSAAHEEQFQIAPRSMFNTKITGSRRYAAQSYDLNRFKGIAKSTDSTVNDVVLSVMGGALRQYMMEQNQLTKESLITAVPISNQREETGFGNDLSILMAPIGSNIELPLDRLSHIKQDIQKKKALLSSLSKSEYLMYLSAMITPGAIQLSTGIGDSLLPANMVISNVAGPQSTLYWNGSQLEGFYPVSLIVDRMALNITLVSYDGHMDFGITACRKSLPSIQRILELIENSISAHEDALKIEGILKNVSKEGKTTISDSKIIETV